MKKTEVGIVFYLDGSVGSITYDGKDITVDCTDGPFIGPWSPSIAKTDE